MAIEKKKDGTITFKFTIPWKDIKGTYDNVLQEAAKQLEIEGFRKGNAPAKIAEKHLKQDKLFNQVLEKILPEKYIEKIKEHDLKPLSQPRITPLTTEKGQDWEFKTEIAEKPSIKLGEYKKHVQKALENLKDNVKEKVKKPKTKGKKEPSEEAKQAEKARQEMQKGQKKLQAAFDALLDKIEFKIAPMLVEQEAQSALSKLSQQLQQMNVDFKDYLKSIKKSKEELIEEYKKTSEERLRLELILNRIIEQEDPEVTDKELEKLLPKDQEISEHQKEHARYTLKKQKIIDKLKKL